MKTTKEIWESRLARRAKSLKEEKLKKFVAVNNDDKNDGKWEFKAKDINDARALAYKHFGNSRSIMVMEVKPIIKEAWGDMASSTTPSGVKVMASGSTRNTRTYNYEEVTFAFGDKKGFGKYGWQNRPYQRFDFAEALRKAMIDAGVNSELAGKTIDNTSSLKDALEYFAKNVEVKKEEIKEDRVEPFNDRKRAYSGYIPMTKETILNSISDIVGYEVSAEDFDELKIRAKKEKDEELIAMIASYSALDKSKGEIKEARGQGKGQKLDKLFRLVGSLQKDTLSKEEVAKLKKALEDAEAFAPASEYEVKDKKNLIGQINNTLKDKIVESPANPGARVNTLEKGEKIIKEVGHVALVKVGNTNKYIVRYAPGYFVRSFEAKSEEEAIKKFMGLEESRDRESKEESKEINGVVRVLKKKEIKEETSQDKYTLFGVEVGILISKEDDEFEYYANVYDGAFGDFGYYDENIAFFDNKEEAVAWAKDYVEKGVKNTYGIVSDLGLVSKEIKIENGNIDDGTEFMTYKAEDVVKFFRKVDSEVKEVTAIEESMLKEEPVSKLEPRFDSRKSFYNKAKVEEKEDGSKVLYSYGTPVAMIKDGKAFLLSRVNNYYGYSTSPTTLRHVKDFLKQNGFKADSLAQMEKDYKVLNSLSENTIIKEDDDDGFEEVEDGRFKIQYWLTEEDREEGFSDILIDSFDVLEDAIKMAKKMVDRDGIASVEVSAMNDDEVIFGYDGNIKWGSSVEKEQEVVKEEVEKNTFEFCVMDKQGNNIECFQTESEALEFVKYATNGADRILKVMYGPEDKNKDKPELGTETIWSLDESAKMNEELIIKTDIGDFEPWAGAVDTLDKIKEADMLDDLESLLEDMYPDGLTKTELNDILWFESEWILDSLGISESEEEDEEEDEEDEEDKLDESSKVNFRKKHFSKELGLK